MRNEKKGSLRRTYDNMVQRCTNQTNKAYKNYGGRGIYICARWREDEMRGFRNFVSDMGARPFKLTIERKDNDGPYSPDNCKWGTRKEQARNKRKKRIVTISGVPIHVAELSEQTGIDMKTLYWRIQQGWPMKKVLAQTPQWNNTESQKKAVTAHAEQKRAQTHCKRGHELTPENTYAHKGRRACRICRRAWDRFLYYNRTRPIEEFL